MLSRWAGPTQVMAGSRFSMGPPARPGYLVSGDRPDKPGDDVDFQVATIALSGTTLVLLSSHFSETVIPANAEGKGDNSCREAAACAAMSEGRCYEARGYRDEVAGRAPVLRRIERVLFRSRRTRSRQRLAGGCRSGSCFDPFVRRAESGRDCGARCGLGSGRCRWRHPGNTCGCAGPG